MTEYLWAGLGQAPLEYIRYRLRTHFYHCTPKQLDEQYGDNFFEMMQDLRCAEIEEKARQAGRSLSAKP